MKTKERFTVQMNQQIKVYNHLLQGVEVCKETVAKFDGKVLNIRLIKAMKEKANPHSLSFSLNGSISISDYQERWYSMPGDQNGAYIDYYTITVQPITNDANRIDASKTIENANKQTDYLKKNIAQCKADIILFDDEADAWNELKKQVDAYNAKYSYRLRGTIDMRK